MKKLLRSCSLRKEYDPELKAVYGKLQAEVYFRLDKAMHAFFQRIKIGGFKSNTWYNKQLDRIRSKRDRCKKGSRRYKHLSQVYRRVSQQKRNKQRDSLHIETKIAPSIS